MLSHSLASRQRGGRTQAPQQQALLCGLRKGNLEGSGASGRVWKTMDRNGTVYAVKQIDLPTKATESEVLAEARA
eukprot:gene8027-49656_t